MATSPRWVDDMSKGARIHEVPTCRFSMGILFEWEIAGPFSPQHDRVDSFCPQILEGL